MASERITRLASTYPDEIILCHQDGTPLEGEDPLVLDQFLKEGIAECSIIWKTNFEKTLNRMIKLGVEKRLEEIEAKDADKKN